MKTFWHILTLSAGLLLAGSGVQTASAQVSATVVVTLRVVPGPNAEFVQHQPSTPSQMPSIIENGHMTLRGIGSLSVSVQKENSIVHSQLNLSGAAPARLDVGTQGAVKQMTLTYLSS
ncbi:MAG: hypothetical protein ACPL1K_00620 [Candidatus Kryptoniota bacterium]